MATDNGCSCGITTGFTIWCSQCSEWTEQYIKTKAAFIKSMRSDGWKRQKTKDGMEWFCPGCANSSKDDPLHKALGI